IHAIGAGVALCEIQQQSDITYRLYDYGRPRELHLDHGIAVSDLAAYETPQTNPASGPLVECDYFHTDHLVIEKNLILESSKPAWLICLEGEGTIESIPYKPGTAWQLEGTTVVHPKTRSVWLRTSVPLLKEPA